MKRPLLPLDWRAAVRSQRWLSALGVVAAGILAVQANVLVARRYARWDLTTEGRYTLSTPTRALLEALDTPVEVVVLLSRSDRLTVDVRHLLDAYRALTPQLHVRYVDPDSNPAEFLALQERHDLSAGASQDGRVTSDAAFIVTQGDRHWFISSDSLVRLDDQGQPQPRLEAVLTEGIARVTQGEAPRVCFSAGSGELSLDDFGPHGLAELRRRLEQSNFEVDSVELTAPGAPSELAPCDTVVVAGPERPLGAGAQAALSQALDRGAHLFLLVPPLLDADGRFAPTGLESLSERIGVRLEQSFVIDPDPARRVPQGVGEAFFAEPVVHPVTRGLARDEQRIDARPLVVAVRPLVATTSGRALPLLKSSELSFAVDDLRPLEASGGTLEASADADRGPFALGFAVELPAPAGAPSPRGARVVVLGTANVAWGSNWADATLFGGRLLTESALAWLNNRPALVSVPEQASLPAGLTLTEESLGEVQRYVLLYMPFTAALTGVFILLRRRRVERASRRDAS